MKYRLLIVALGFGLGACSWVKPIDGAENIALVKEAHVEHCKRLGKAHVSVKHALSIIERKHSKVAEELIMLAKNEAQSMGGDSIVALTGPAEGKQSFAVYRCQ